MQGCLMDFPKDLLILLLSHCHISSVLAIKLTCHKWNALTETRAFWQRHIDRRMENIVSLSIPLKLRPLFTAFDAFIFKELTLSESCEWLFRKDAWRIRIGADGWFQMIRRVGSSKSILLWRFEVPKFFAIHYSPDLAVLVRNHCWTREIDIEIQEAVDQFAHVILRRENSGHLETFEPVKGKQVLEYGPIYYYRGSTEAGNLFVGSGVRINKYPRPHGTGIDQDGNVVKYRIQKRIKLDG
jgi:hypothetical protein